MAIKHFNAFLKDGLRQCIGNKRINILAFDISHIYCIAFSSLQNIRFCGGFKNKKQNCELPEISRMEKIYEEPKWFSNNNIHFSRISRIKLYT